jgi:hypothetical protein
MEGADSVVPSGGLWYQWHYNLRLYNKEAEMSVLRPGYP